jgi:YhcH/YjgK/YiaL family protein
MRIPQKKTLRVLFLLAISLAIISCQTQTSFEKMSPKQIDKWFSAGEWLNGCQLKPHSSVNKKAFAKEYFTNRIFWDKTFEWLKTNDLDTISPGRYVIDEGNVTATVSEALAPELEKVRWEIHQNFNDLQYIVKGRARMGSVPVSEATVAEALDPRRDIGFYNADGELYVAEPGTFFIFTPDDVHRPGIKADNYDEPVRKIVIKIRSAGSE